MNSAVAARLQMSWKSYQKQRTYNRHKPFSTIKHQPQVSRFNKQAYQVKRPTIKPGNGGYLYGSTFQSCQSIAGVGTGLVNLGNTCFLNSVIQCLVSWYPPRSLWSLSTLLPQTHTTPLKKRLIAREHSRVCRNSSEFCLLCWMEKHVKAVTDQAAKKAVSPKELVYNLKKVVPTFSLGRQVDQIPWTWFLICDTS